MRAPVQSAPAQAPAGGVAPPKPPTIEQLRKETQARLKSLDAGPLDDLGTRLKQGVARLPGQVAGLVDVVNPLTYATNTAMVSDATGWIGEKTGFQPGKWADEMQAELSPKAQAAAADLDRVWENGTAGEIAKEYLKNPVENIGGLLAETLPLTLAGGFAGRGVAMAGQALTKAAAPAAQATGAALTRFAPAIGEGAISAGALNEGLLDQGVDPAKAGLVSAGAGATTGFFGHQGRRLAERLGFGDMDAVLAGTSRVAPNQHGLGARLAGGAAIEGFAEELPQSVFEQGWQNVGLDQPITEGMARAGVEGAIAGGIMGAGFNALPQRGLDAGRLVDEATRGGPVSGFADPQALRDAALNPQTDEVTRASALAAVESHLHARDPILAEMWRKASVESIAGKRSVAETLAEIQSRMARTSATPNTDTTQQAPNAQPIQPVPDVPAGPRPLTDAARQGGVAPPLGVDAPVPVPAPGGRQSVPPVQPAGSTVPLVSGQDDGAVVPGAAGQNAAGLTEPAPRQPIPAPPAPTQEDFDRWAAGMRGEPTGTANASTQAPPTQITPTEPAPAPDTTGAAGRGLGAPNGVSAADAAQQAAGFEPTLARDPEEEAQPWKLLPPRDALPSVTTPELQGVRDKLAQMIQKEQSDRTTPELIDGKTLLESHYEDYSKAVDRELSTRGSATAPRATGVDRGAKAKQEAQAYLEQQRDNAQAKQKSNFRQQIESRIRQLHDEAKNRLAAGEDEQSIRASMEPQRRTAQAAITWLKWNAEFGEQPPTWLHEFVMQQNSEDRYAEPAPAVQGAPQPTQAVPPLPVGQNANTGAPVSAGMESQAATAGMDAAADVVPVRQTGADGGVGGAGVADADAPVATRPFATIEEREAVISSLQAAASQQFGSTTDKIIRDALEFGADPQAMRQAIENGDEAQIEAVADAAYQQSSGRKQGFGLMRDTGLRTGGEMAQPHPADDYRNWEALSKPDARKLAEAVGVKVRRGVGTRVILERIDEQPREAVRAAWDRAFGNQPPINTAPAQGATGTAPDQAQTPAVEQPPTPRQQRRAKQTANTQAITQEGARVEIQGEPGKVWTSTGLVTGKGKVKRVFVRDETGFERRVVGVETARR
jgi:hypothetical protein